MAEELKKKGNEALANGKNEEAIQFFTQAITLDPSNHILYSNRSAAYAGSGNYANALVDAEKVIAIKPDWFKGYSRKGAALQFMGKMEEAHEAYSKGLEIDPNNETLKASKAELEAEISREAHEFTSKIFGPDMFAKLRANPVTAEFMNDPTFKANMEAVQRNPKHLQSFMADQRYMTALGVLMGLPDQSGNAPQQSQPKPSSAPKPTPTPAPAAAPTSTLTPQQAEAEKEKELGTAAYKAQKFDQAAMHYLRAIELYPQDSTYRSNLAAVYLESGKYEQCIEECNKALEEARNFKQVQLIPKILTRIGNAYSKMERWEDAITAYQKSLTENRNADTLARLQRAEKAKKEFDEKAYLSSELSIVEKNKGNEFFKNADYPQAVTAYTEAIKRNPTDHVLYSNRSASYQKLQEYPSALKDAEKCIEIAPSFVRGYIRKASCHFFMKEYHKAIATYDQALKIDPENQEALDGMARIEEAISRQQDTGKPDEEQLKHAMADPEIQGILQDPLMQQILRDLSTDPKSSQKHLQNPQVMARLNKLVAAGVIRLG